VETAAVEEIDQRWAFSNNLLMISTAAGKSLRQEHFGFFTVTTGSTTINPGRQKSKHPNSEKRHLHKVQDTPNWECFAATFFLPAHPLLYAAYLLSGNSVC
jgi:hypothetical protein